MKVLLESDVQLTGAPLTARYWDLTDYKDKLTVSKFVFLVTLQKPELQKGYFF